MHNFAVVNGDTFEFADKARLCAFSIHPPNNNSRCLLRVAQLKLLFYSLQWKCFNSHKFCIYCSALLCKSLRSPSLIHLSTFLLYEEHPKLLLTSESNKNLLLIRAGDERLLSLLTSGLLSNFEVYLYTAPAMEKLNSIPNQHWRNLS